MSYFNSNPWPYIGADGIVKFLSDPLPEEADYAAHEIGLSAALPLKLKKIRGGVPLYGRDIGFNFEEIKKAINNLNDRNFHPDCHISPALFTAPLITQRQVAVAVRADYFSEYKRVPRLDLDGALCPATYLYSIPDNTLWIGYSNIGPRIRFGSGESIWAELTPNGWFDGYDAGEMEGIFSNPGLSWDYKRSILLATCDNYTENGRDVSPGFVMGGINFCGETLDEIFFQEAPEGIETAEDAAIEFDEDRELITFNLGNNIIAYINASGRHAGNP